MRVLLVAEGVHELGDEQVEGALSVLVRRLLDRQVTFTCIKVSSPEVELYMRPGKGLDNQKRALGWVRYAREQKCFDAIILIIDRDEKRQRQEGLDAAQEEPDLAFPRALGTAIEAFEAWMLADEKALSKALGLTVQRQPDPESIPRPKGICEAFPRGGARLRDVYARIAQVTDLATIEKRCPKGFGPFAQRVRALASPSR